MNGFMYKEIDLRDKELNVKMLHDTPMLCLDVM